MFPLCLGRKGGWGLLGMGWPSGLRALLRAAGVVRAEVHCKWLRTGRVGIHLGQARVRLIRDSSNNTSTCGCLLEKPKSLPSLRWPRKCSRQYSSGSLHPLSRRQQGTCFRSLPRSCCKAARNNSARFALDPKWSRRLALSFGLLKLRLQLLDLALLGLPQLVHHIQPSAHCAQPYIEQASFNWNSFWPMSK